MDSSEDEEESDENEDQTATKVLHQRFSEKMLEKYRKFIRKTGYTPYVKKGKTITMAKNAVEFREALADGVESDDDSDGKYNALHYYTITDLPRSRLDVCPFPKTLRGCVASGILVTWPAPENQTRSLWQRRRIFEGHEL